MNVKFYQTRTFLNTPLHNPTTVEHKEITITDLKHPLYGKTFPVVSSNFKQNLQRQYLLVQHGEYVLRILISVTNLCSQPNITPVILTSTVVENVIALARECDKLCQFNLSSSGSPCQTAKKKK